MVEGLTCKCGTRIIEKGKYIACPYCSPNIDLHQHSEVIPENYKNKATKMMAYYRENFDIDYDAIEDIIGNWIEPTHILVGLLKSADKEQPQTMIQKDSLTYLKKHLNSDNLSHCRDDRTTVEYALQLLLAWIEEDLIVEELGEKLFDLNLGGGDSKREFLNNPSGTPDINVEETGNRVEIVHSFTGNWKDGTIDLRDKKWGKIGQTDYILGIEYERDYIFLVQKDDIQDVEKIDSHAPYGGKPATNVSIPDKAFKDGKMLIS